jgi:hypothetical protein
MKDNEFEVVLELLRKKIGVEPSVMRLMVHSDDIMSQFKNKTKLWFYSVLTDDGVIKDTEVLFEYDPGNIYVFKSWEKVFIIYAAQHKSSVDFLVKNIYKQVKNKKNGNNK